MIAYEKIKKALTDIRVEYFLLFVAAISFITQPTNIRFFNLPFPLIFLTALMFLVILSGYSKSECYSLACLYHAAGKDKKINLISIFNMLNDLLKTILIRDDIEKKEVWIVSFKIKTKIYMYYLFGVSPTKIKSYMVRMFK